VALIVNKTQLNKTKQNTQNKTSEHVSLCHYNISIIAMGLRLQFLNIRQKSHWGMIDP